MFLKIAEFLFALMLPFQDLPRVILFGFELRPSMFFLPILGAHFLYRFYSDRKALHHIPKKVLLSLCLLVGYTALHVVVVHHDNRAIGFTIWLLVNVFTLFYAFIIRAEWLSKGYFIGIFVGVLHILIQRYNPFFAVEPIKILNLVDYQAQIRVFSLFGEPSFACLNILFLYCYLLFRKERIYYFISFLVLLGASFTYSRMGNLGIVILLISKVALDLKNRTLSRSTLFHFASVIFIYALTNVYFVHKYDPNKWSHLWKDAEYATIANHIQEKTHFESGKSFYQRKAAFERGMEVIKAHPLVGVGFGNSKAYIFENKIHPEYRGFYEGIHNLYQEIWAEVGLIGLALFLFFIVSILPISYVSGEVSPYLFTLFYSMQFCQNINMPVIWLGLIAMLYYYRKPKEC